VLAISRRLGEGFYLDDIHVRVCRFGTFGPRNVSLEISRGQEVRVSHNLAAGFKLRIGGETIVEIAGFPRSRTVRLAIAAPRHITISRDEQNQASGIGHQAAGPSHADARCPMPVAQGVPA
jgi:sRNA-binding carbon storage regulator CsrA